MDIKRYELLTTAGNVVNEDLARRYENYFWLLDGSSGLSPEKIMSGTTDARWFVERTDAHLQTACDATLPLDHIVEKTIGAVAAEFALLDHGVGWQRYQYPSCSLGVIRLHEGVEYLLLGDVTLAVKSENGIQVIADSTVSQLDAQVIGRLQAIREHEKLSFADAKTKVSPLLKQNRAMMNSVGGYWVMGLEPTAVHHALTGSINRKKEMHLLLASDGFTRLVDTLEAFRDWEELFAYVQVSGLEKTMATLRAIERSDPECSRYPRLKVFDDATAIYVSLAAY